MPNSKAKQLRRIQQRRDRLQRQREALLANSDPDSQVVVFGENDSPLSPYTQLGQTLDNRYIKNLAREQWRRLSRQNLMKLARFRRRNAPRSLPEVIHDDGVNYPAISLLIQNHFSRVPGVVSK